MFKYCTLLFLFLGCFITKAQEVGLNKRPVRNFEKGTFIATLDGGGGFNNNSAYKRPVISLTPSLGYFVASNLAAGVQFSYGNESQIFKGSSSTINYVFEHYSNSLAPELFLRYYTPNWKVKPFVQVSAGYNLQWGRFENSQGEMDKLRSGNLVGAGEFGLMFPIGKKFSLDVRYRKRFFSKSDFPDANKDNSFRLGVSFRF